MPKDLKEKISELVELGKKVEAPAPSARYVVSEDTVLNWLKPIIRTCWSCKKEYEGVRIICEEVNCIKSWNDHVRDSRYKHGSCLTNRKVFLTEGLPNKK